MSRSYRHTPICGITTARTDKPAKADANRTLRAANRVALSGCTDYDDLSMPTLRQVSNVWSFPKDGKQYLKSKDAPWYRKCMRK